MEYFNSNIYPIADLAIKIMIGLIVVIYLHRRTYQDKIKEKLIDSYMEYLDKFKNFSIYELYIYEKEFYKQLSGIVKEKITDENIKDVILQKINVENKRLSKNYDDNWFETNANFSPYTYKFCFLIGTRYYFKHIQPLENNFTKFLFDNTRYNKTINQIINTIECINKINNLSIDNVGEIFSDIKVSYSKEIIKIHQRDNLKYFNPYSNKVADKIGKM